MHARAAAVVAAARSFSKVPLLPAAPRRSSTAMMRANRHTLLQGPLRGQRTGRAHVSAHALNPSVSTGREGFDSHVKCKSERTAGKTTIQFDLDLPCKQAAAESSCKVCFWCESTITLLLVHLCLCVTFPWRYKCA